MAIYVRSKSAAPTDWQAYRARGVPGEESSIMRRAIMARLTSRRLTSQRASKRDQRSVRYRPGGFLAEVSPGRPPVGGVKQKRAKFEQSRTEENSFRLPESQRLSGHDSDEDEPPPPNVEVHKLPTQAPQPFQDAKDWARGRSHPPANDPRGMGPAPAPAGDPGGRKSISHEGRQEFSNTPRMHTSHI